MSSRIFSESKAKDFAQRIQALSGNELEKMTNYVDGGYGEQRYMFEVDVLKNIEIINDAIKNYKYVRFEWNVYDVEDDKIVLRYVNERKVKPLKLILYNGRYCLLARQYGEELVKTYNIDLMREVREVRVRKKDEFDDKDIEINFQYSLYDIQHPFNFGGKENTYKLRVNREYFSRLVDEFSYGIKVIKGSVTKKTVDVTVQSSEMGMMYWLLQHYDVAELLSESDKKLSDELSNASEILYNRYHKK